MENKVETNVSTRRNTSRSAAFRRAFPTLSHDRVADKWYGSKSNIFLRKQLTPTKPRNLCQYSWPDINHCQWHKPMEGRELTSAERSAMSKRETTDRGAICRIASLATHTVCSRFSFHTCSIIPSNQDSKKMWKIVTAVEGKREYRAMPGQCPNFSYPSFSHRRFPNGSF